MTIFESEMVTQIQNYFINRGFEVIPEVPFFSKRIDLMCINDNEILAVEAKIRNWKRAIWQAYVNQLYSNKSYVAIWHEYCHRAIAQREVFKRHGIGLMEVNGTIDIIIEAKVSSCFERKVVNQIIENIRSGVRENGSYKVKK